MDPLPENFQSFLKQSFIKAMGKAWPFLLLSFTIVGMVIVAAAAIDRFLAGEYFRGTFLVLAALTVPAWPIVLLAMDFVEHRTKPGPLRWCGDCGKQYIKMSRQKGFDARSGAPRLTTEWSCPDWVGTVYSESDPGNCGETVKTKWQPAATFVTPPTDPMPAHTCQPGDPKAECPACRELMVRSGVLSTVEASYFDKKSA